ncbi:MAG TPA: alpha/beta hydrolase [Steroidobacteraceae bacterium]|jgi:pimeloyl-ACP methyl ester carboxylesterase|nr:alpha/beta hydrolase [Steroidobacteraceae bacterium]
MSKRGSYLTLALAAAWVLNPSAAPAQQVEKLQQVESRFAVANGVRLRYIVTGQGDPVLLLHGFGQSSQMWRPLMRELSKDHTVIAVDLRGAGQSDAPADGYLKSEMARDVHALMSGLGYSKVSVVGHDIGMMVAYAYAAQFPHEVQKIVLMEALLPGVGEWTRIWPRDQWHLRFFGKTPEALVQGRERIYLEHFWNDFAADPAKSIAEADRKEYAAEYARPNHIRASMEWFRLIDEDAREFHEYAAKPLTLPMLVLTGEKGSGDGLIKQAQLIDTDVQGAVVPGAGHWLMEEAPGFVIPKIVEFLRRPGARTSE